MQSAVVALDYCTEHQTIERNVILAVYAVGKQADKTLIPEIYLGGCKIVKTVRQTCIPKLISEFFFGQLVFKIIADIIGHGVPFLEITNNVDNTVRNYHRVAGTQ